MSKQVNYNENLCAGAAIRDDKGRRISKLFEASHPKMTVGYAKNLIMPDDPTEQEFNFRQSGGGLIEDGVAVIDKVKGKSLVWNQMADTLTSSKWSNRQGNVTYLNNVLIYNKNSETEYAENSPTENLAYFKSGHKYLCTLVVTNVNNGNIQVGESDTSYFFNTSTIGFHYGFLVATTNDLLRYVAGGTSISVKDIFVYDLTQMFGAGNEPTTYEEFLQLKPKVADEYAYNEGTIVDNKVEKVVTTGRNLFNPNVETEYLAVTGQSGSERYVKRFKALPGTYFIKSINNESVYVKSVINGVYGSARALNSNVTITLDSYGEIWVYSETEAKINGVANDICINVSDPVINGKYFPYEKHELDLAWIKDIKDGEGVKLFEDGMKSAGTAFDEVGKNKAVKRIGVKVFDGTELFERYVRDSNLAILYTDTLSKVRKVKAANVASALYKTATGSWNTMSSDKMICGYPDLGRIAFRDDIYTTAAAWKQHLADLYAAGTPLVVYYELAEPIEVEYDEKSLTYPVVAGGTEEAIASEPSSAFRADIGYGIDAVKTILDLKARVEALEAK